MATPFGREIFTITICLDTATNFSGNILSLMVNLYRKLSGSLPVQRLFL